MSAKLQPESRGPLLVVRVVGDVGFDEADFALTAELTALLRGHSSSGGTQVLLDLSRARFIYGSSFSLLLEPILDPGTGSRPRTAFVVGTNEATRNRFVMTRLSELFPPFELEADALRFLESGAPA